MEEEPPLEEAVQLTEGGTEEEVVVPTSSEEVAEEPIADEGPAPDQDMPAEVEGEVAELPHDEEVQAAEEEAS